MNSPFRLLDSKTILVASIALGTFIRVLLMPTTTSVFDVAEGWVAIIDSYYSGDTLYNSGWYLYPPIWGYILACESLVFNLIGLGSFGENVTQICTGYADNIGYGLITNPLVTFSLNEKVRFLH